jgi:hypothetical protein
MYQSEGNDDSNFETILKPARLHFFESAQLHLHHTSWIEHWGLPLHIPEPLSITSAAISSSSAMIKISYGGWRFTSWIVNERIQGGVPVPYEIFFQKETGRGGKKPPTHFRNSILWTYTYMNIWYYFENMAQCARQMTIMDKNGRSFELFWNPSHYFLKNIWEQIIIPVEKTIATI